MRTNLLILLVDDDLHMMEELVSELRYHGHSVDCRSSVLQAMKQFKLRDYDVVITDLSMPTPMTARGSDGLGGLRFAHWVRRRAPNTRLIIHSAYPQAAYELKNKPGVFLFSKGEMPDVVRCVNRLVFVDLSIFVVHGRNANAVERIRQALRDHWGWTKVKSLGELAGGALTIMEKFEKYADDADMALVLFTPDDFGKLNTEADLQHRARQNVVFELGYFMGKLSRSNGNIVLLKDGDMELPSDINGVSYIDVSKDATVWLGDLKREVDALLGFEWIPPDAKKPG